MAIRQAVPCPKRGPHGRHPWENGQGKWLCLGVSPSPIDVPWTWQGGYPQRITNPSATLIAEVYENPDVPAVIAPLICEAVNAYFGVDGTKTYRETP